MINSLMSSAFVDILKNEWLGIIASAFILVSFLFTKQMVTRLINMVGCIVFVIYGLLLPTYSTAFMNGALFIVHVIYLTKDFLARKKEKTDNSAAVDMKLDGIGLFVNDMATMIRFYRDVLGFEIKESEDAVNVYLIKDGTLFMLYGRDNFEKMTNTKYKYTKGLNGHSEIALYVDTFDEVDARFAEVVSKGATPVLEPTTESWGQRTCYIADPEGNLVEIGSFNKPFQR